MSRLIFYFELFIFYFELFIFYSLYYLYEALIILTPFLFCFALKVECFPINRSCYLLHFYPLYLWTSVTHRRLASTLLALLVSTVCLQSVLTNLNEKNQSTTIQP